MRQEEEEEEGSFTIGVAQSFLVSFPDKRCQLLSLPIQLALSL